MGKGGRHRNELGLNTTRFLPVAAVPAWPFARGTATGKRLARDHGSSSASRAKHLPASHSNVRPHRRFTMRAIFIVG